MKEDASLPITVCLVEDDAELRESVVRYLRGTPGLRCLGAYASGEEALEAIPAKRPAVVLMDINLPSMSGIECVRQLKLRLPTAQVVMLTVYEDTDQVFQSLAAGAVGYLTKSTRQSQILEGIREVQRGGSPMSSHIARKVVQAFQPASHAEPSHERLSPREQQVLNWLAKGAPYKQIADAMGISIETVRTYIRRIYQRLHVQSRIEAVLKYRGSSGGLPGSLSP